MDIAVDLFKGKKKKITNKPSNLNSDRHQAEQTEK